MQCIISPAIYRRIIMQYATRLKILDTVHWATQKILRSLVTLQIFVNKMSLLYLLYYVACKLACLCLEKVNFDLFTRKLKIMSIKQPCCKLLYKFIAELLVCYSKCYQMGRDLTTTCGFTRNLKNILVASSRQNEH